MGLLPNIFAKDVETPAKDDAVVKNGVTLIKPTRSSDNYCGENALEIARELLAAGFESVALKPVKKLSKRAGNKYGKVVSISINGKNEFFGIKKVPSTSLIVIEYSDFKKDVDMSVYAGVTKITPGTIQRNEPKVIDQEDGPASRSETKRLCPYCGNALGFEGEKFCSHCGKEILISLKQHKQFKKRAEMKKCPKCGAELSDDTKFCSYCGQRIEAKTVTLPPIRGEKPETSKYEQIKVNAPESNVPKSSENKTKEKKTARSRKPSILGKMRTVLIPLFMLLCLVAFYCGNTAAGIISILQIVLAIVAVPMRKQATKASKGWLRFITLALAIALLFPYMSLFGANLSVPRDAEEFLWSDIVLGTMLPEPKSHIGEIYGNTDESLLIYVYETSAGDFDEYVDACKERGYTVEADQSDISYSAYNAEGYDLSLSYYESRELMHISVDAARQYGTLEWPEGGIASMLPVPTSTTGKIMRDDEQGFRAHISNMPVDGFKSYVTECANVGFSIDSYDSDTSYSAENSEGYKLFVTYQGNGVISISVDEPEYEVTVETECVENLMFSTYDVDVYIDDILKGTIGHGTTGTYTATLPKGTYEIKYVSAEDDEVTGTVQIDIHQDELLKYKISCSSTGIGVETIVGTIPEYGEDEAPIPQSAAGYKYENYADVQQELGAAGFTNITFEILYDIEIGWTEEGEVDSISVDGNAEFEKYDIFKKDALIVITYHMNVEDDPNRPIETQPVETKPAATETPKAEPTERPVETETPVANLTAENCPDLDYLLALRDPSDPAVADFANEYSGRVIEFDGCVHNMQNHGSYTTRWDVLLGAGDFDPNSMRGPNFRLTDVNFYDMNVSGGDSVYAGLNVHIVAKVGKYNANTTLFELDIISMEIR